MTSHQTSDLRVLVAQIGSRRAYAVPRILHQAGLLEHLVTDLALEVVPFQPLRDLLGGKSWRMHGLPSDKVSCFPLFGLHRAIMNRLSCRPGPRLRAYTRWNRRFCRLVVDRSFGGENLVYTYNCAGLEILQHAKARACGTVMDQTAAPWATEEPLIDEERALWPGWEYAGATRADWRELAEREEREWALADVIVCGSEYVVDCLRRLSGPADKCAVVPYGVEEGLFAHRVRNRRDEPLRVLSVGTAQLRKGVQYLMEAARLLARDRFVFRWVGPVRVSPQAVAELSAAIELAGPVPRSALQNVYDWADVLVLPSLSEGSANVCYEALACGLPVVTTPNAGSVVRDGIDGFVVPIRSPEGIAARLLELASNSDRLERMSRNTTERVPEFTWTAYAQRLLTAIGANRFVT